MPTGCGAAMDGRNGWAAGPPGQYAAQGCAFLFIASTPCEKECCGAKATSLSSGTTLWEVAGEKKEGSHGASEVASRAATRQRRAQRVGIFGKQAQCCLGLGSRMRELREEERWEKHGTRPAARPRARR